MVQILLDFAGTRLAMTEVRRAMRTAAGRWAAFFTAMVLAACSAGDRDSAAPDAGSSAGTSAAPKFPTAATLGVQALRSPGEYLAMEPYASADPAAGSRAAALCRACHTFGAGEQALLGPNLHGLFGRKAGTIAGFDYSEALRGADFTWTPRALDAWLAQPARFLPGNRMAFVGVSDAGERANLIAYLLAATGEGGGEE